MTLSEDLWGNNVSPTRVLKITIGFEIIVNGLVYPFYLCKTHLQVRPHHKALKHDPLMEVWREGIKRFRYFGVAGLYRGFTWSTISATPALIAHITLYASIKNKLGYQEIPNNKQNNNNNNNNNNEILSKIPNIMIPLVSGLIAESVSILFQVPCDIITQDLILSEKFEKYKNNNKNIKTVKRTSLSNIIKTIYKQDGIINGFWRGTQAAYLTYLPGAGIWWMSYELFKKMICEKYSLNNFIGYSLTGIAAGATTGILTNPIDVIRVRIQTKTSDYGESSIKQLIKQIYKHEGAHGFGRGAGARVLLMLAEGILFADFYELVMMPTQ